MQYEIFLVLGMLSDFLLHPGHFYIIFWDSGRGRESTMWLLLGGTRSPHPPIILDWHKKRSSSLLLGGLRCCETWFSTRTPLTLPSGEGKGCLITSGWEWESSVPIWLFLVSSQWGSCAATTQWELWVKLNEGEFQALHSVLMSEGWDDTIEFYVIFGLSRVIIS